jgi:hypothetical protein
MKSLNPNEEFHDGRQGLEVCRDWSLAVAGNHPIAAFVRKHDFLAAVHDVDQLASVIDAPHHRASGS